MRWAIAMLAVALVTTAAACAREQAAGRPWVRDLELRGVRSVSSRDLRKRISVEETSRIPLAPRRYLDPFAVETDRERIEAYYRARGYFAARVTSAEVIPRGSRSVDVRFSIDEGRPTYLRRVRISGLAPLGPERRKLLRELRLRPGQRFDHASYLAARDRLQASLRARGYAWAQVSGEVLVDPDARTAIVSLKVDPGVRARIGRVTVKGAVRSDPAAIARHAALPRRAPFSPELLEEARARIYGLGMFSWVQVRARPAPSGPALADVVITVEEGPFHELRVGGGFGLEPRRNDLHLLLSYTKRNFLGGLRTLELELEPAYVVIPALWDPILHGPAIASEARLIQPDLGWTGLQLRLVLGYDLGLEYAYRFHGPRAQLWIGRVFFGNRLRLATSYNLQLLDFFQTDPTILDDPAQAGRLFGYVDPYRVGWWQLDAAIDLRDRPLEARRGVYLALSVELSGLYTGSAFRYQKLLPEARGYLPLGKRVVIAVRGQYGYLSTRGELGSPITRRFYLGGPSSHRGFTYNRLSLQVPSGVPGIDPLPIGGDRMLLLSGELRVSIVQIAGSWVGLVAFLDAGDVSAPSCVGSTCVVAATTVPDRIVFSRLHLATGGGLRVRTPIGTLRADLGVRLNRLAPTEPDGVPNPDPGQRVAFHLSIGEAF